MQVGEGVVLALDPDIEMSQIALPVILKLQAQNVMKKVVNFSGQE